MHIYILYEQVLVVLQGLWKNTVSEKKEKQTNKQTHIYVTNHRRAGKLPCVGARPWEARMKQLRLRDEVFVSYKTQCGSMLLSHLGME